MGCTKCKKNKKKSEPLFKKVTKIISTSTKKILEGAVK